LAEKIILLSNDDGIHAPGLATAREKLRRLGRVIVVAPDRQRSGAGHSLTLDVPLRVNRLEDDVMSVTGTPTDCVLLAVRNLLDARPDILVSGVNRGPNLGDDVTYSGTVAAAMEGTLLGIPSVAVSLDRSPTDRYDYGCAAEIAVSIGRLVLKRGIPPGALLNVNVPSLPMDEIKGVRITKQGKQSYDEPIVEKTDPRGRLYYWIGGPQATWEKDPDTDFAAVASGYVSVTPIDLDFTDYDAFDELRDWPLVDVAGGATAGETLAGAADTTRKDDE
jgi:5'-nucleotidase